MSTDLKTRGINISLSTVATLIPVMAAVWFLVRPALVESISTAVAADFDDQISKQTAPLQNAFKVIIKADIDELKRDIALLLYREERDEDNWKEEDVRLLSNKRIELEALEEAYDEL